MDLDKVIEHFGDTKALCDALDVTKGAVSQWRATGIPPLRQYQIETLTHGKFIAKREPARQSAA